MQPEVEESRAYSGIESGSGPKWTSPAHTLPRTTLSLYINKKQGSPTLVKREREMDDHCHAAELRHTMNLKIWSVAMSMSMKNEH